VSDDSELPIISWQHLVTNDVAREMGAPKARRTVNLLCSVLFEAEFPADFIATLGLSQNWQALAMASHAMIWGRGERINQILEREFSEPGKRKTIVKRARVGETADAWPTWLEAEIAFLRATSARYSGTGGEFLELYERRHETSNREHQDYFERIELKYLLQLGCQLLNQGRCKESQQLLDQVLGNDLYLDRSSAMFATSASALNFVNLGLTGRAKQCLAELRSLGRLLPSRARPIQGAAGRSRAAQPVADYARLQSRYIALVCADAGRVLPDRKVVRELNLRLSDRSLGMPSQFDLLSLQSLVRVYLRSGMLALAEQSMRSLQASLAQFRLASEIMNFAEERLELSIMQKAVTEASCQEARNEIAAAIERGDLRSEMRLKTLLGAAYALTNKLRESNSLLLDAARIGVAQSLKTDLFDTYFHLAGLFLIQKNRSKSLGYLDLCLALAREQDAVSLADALGYLASVYDTQQLDPEKLAALSSTESSSINEFYLYHYGFLERIEFSVGSHGVYRSLSEKVTRELAFRPDSMVYYEGKLTVLICQEKGQVVARSFTGEDDFASILFALFDGKSGLTISQMHFLRSPSSRMFDSERHSPVIRGFITRMRQNLDGIPAKLEFSGSTGCYSLRTSMRIIVVRAQSVRRHEQGSRRNTREDFIMQFARSHPRFQVAELCRELRVTRQALHPILARLVERGDLIMVRRGRSSGYRLGASKKT
jgi:hypothetical protein